MIDVFIQKAKIYITETPSFYKNPFNFPNKSIFHYLSVKNESEFLISNSLEYV